MTETAETIRSVTPDADNLAELVIPEDLIRRYDKAGPRYTSYPTADRFQVEYPPASHAANLQRRSSQSSPLPLSVYVHLPFCRSLCYFCACNKIITNHPEKSGEYLQVLFAEMELVGQHLGDDRRMEQLHLGGGTPTFLNTGELTELMQQLRGHFDFAADAELGIEIDPRTVTPDLLTMLAGLGFNRTSFGVQDFDAKVQEAVNRIQPYEMVASAMEAARKNGFGSINTDLIYGLPHQTIDSFARTLDQLIALAPDRIALYNYAHLPERFRAQRLIKAEDLPSAELKLEIFLMSLRRLLDAGYVYIGLDHFARPEDALNQAQLDHSLHRNFQGYTTCADTDLIGLGMSAIGKMGDSYVQNHHAQKPWTDAILCGELPIARGYDLDADDVLRREVIMDIMCGVPLDFAAIGTRHKIDFQAYFASELQQMQEFADLGLISMDAHSLKVNATGRLFLRPMAMLFDRYLQQPGSATYSKLI